MTVVENYLKIRSNIQKHCEEIKRNPDEISVLIVSKTQPVEKIQALYDFGIRDFGENKVQELLEKAPLLPSDIKWHLIGHLQTNKVKYIASFIHLIHSVDRDSLADEIQKQAEKSRTNVNVLLQMRVAQEETKFGCEPEKMKELLTFISAKKNLKVCGCMTMASFTENQEQLNTEYGRFFQNIPEEIKQNPTSIYSAGMTGDYLTAISNGANLVRIGTAIFGERIY